MKIEISGGPFDGRWISPPKVSNVALPIPVQGGWSRKQYTLRRCRDRAGNVVEVLAQAGRDIDPEWLGERGLSN